MCSLHERQAMCITDQLQHSEGGFEDGYDGNRLYVSSDGAYGSGSPVVHSNTVWSPTGAVTEGGKPLKEYHQEEAAHDDPVMVAVAAAYPRVEAVLAIARNILKLV